MIAASGIPASVDGSYPLPIGRARIAMHDTLLDRYGGHPAGGARGASFEGIDAVVQAVKNSYYESLHELAAAYAVYIIQGHVFADGNKPTGAAAWWRPYFGRRDRGDDDRASATRGRQ
jgi:hypothetical protein